MVCSAQDVVLTWSNGHAEVMDINFMGVPHFQGAKEQSVLSRQPIM